MSARRVCTQSVTPPSTDPNIQNLGLLLIRSGPVCHTHLFKNHSCRLDEPRVYTGDNLHVTYLEFFHFTTSRKDSSGTDLETRKFQRHGKRFNVMSRKVLKDPPQTGLHQHFQDTSGWSFQPRVSTSYITHYIVPGSYRNRKSLSCSLEGGGGRGFCQKGDVGFSAWGTVRKKRIFWNFYHPLCEFLWSVAPIQVHFQVNLGSLDWMA